MKRWFIIFSLTILIVECFSFSANASIRPIIINDNPSPLLTYNHTIQLRWYIIDDNPHFYEIFENGQVLQPNKTISEDLILYNFSSIMGYYNISLFVFDYSNYVASSNISIIIGPNQTENSGKGYTMNSSTPGFTISMFIVSILILSSIPIIKRKRKPKW